MLETLIDETDKRASAVERLVAGALRCLGLRRGEGVTDEQARSYMKDAETLLRHAVSVAERRETYHG